MEHHAPLKIREQTRRALRQFIHELEAAPTLSELAQVVATWKAKCER